MTTCPPPVPATVPAAPRHALARLAGAGVLAIASTLMMDPAQAQTDPAPGGPVLTIAEGRSTLLSGGQAYLAAPGVRLRACDVLRTGAQGFVQLEWPDGARIELGPDTRFALDVPYAGEPVQGPHVLALGWAKLTVPERAKAAPWRVGLPHAALLSDAGVAVLRASADGSEFFVEQGRAQALAGGAGAAARTPVPAGRTYSRKAGPERGSVAESVHATFVQAMPRAFRDTLPALLGQLKAGPVALRPDTGYDPADDAGWLRTAPELRGCFADDSVRSAQEALERLGIAVGPLDGIVGPRTRAAVREFQQRQSLPRTGLLDDATLRALEVPVRR